MTRMTETKGTLPGATMATTFFAALVALGGGCGNYSNEDLEFMNALPKTEDVSLEAPLQSAVRPALEDDALKMTTDVTTSANATAAGLLAIVDKIRTVYPTSRDGDTRVWGPWPADDNPGWQIELIMTKSLAADGVTPHFAYDTLMIPPAGTLPNGGISTLILAGWFESTGRARAGAGQMILTPKEARDSGATLKGLEKLVTLMITYDNRAWPRSLDMTIDNVPPIDATMEAQSVTYHYERAQNGDGAMTFTFLKDVVMGPLGVDTLSVESHWHGTGEGRAAISVLAGDAAGLSWTDCWAATSLTSYNERTGAGDPATCISLL